MTGYSNPPKGAFELSQFDIKEGESKVDFWRREISFILDNDLETIIENPNFIGIKEQVYQVYTSFLMFFKTDDEFIINDSGTVYERQMKKIDSKYHEQYIKMAEQLGEDLYNVNGFSQIAKREIKNNSSYLDNFLFMPISPKFAIVSVNVLWKIKLLGFLDKKVDDLKSPILEKYVKLPINNYKNKHLMKKEFDHKLKQYKYIPESKNDLSAEDLFIYNPVRLNEIETIYINHLMMNEVFRYLCYKSHDNMIKFIQTYNNLTRQEMVNLKNNYNGYVSLILKQKEKEV